MSPKDSIKSYSHDQAWDSGHLPVGSIHKIHYTQYGNKSGKPVLFLHGGPGGRTSIDNTAFFDPQIYRVVLLDQRGAGKSTPSCELRENTSGHLVDDIEALRCHVGIDKWFMVFGGSWGSTLALLYAETHPERLSSMVLRGIFTARKSEVAFSRTPHGAARLFPEGWEKLVAYLPEEERGDLLRAYHRRLTSADANTRVEAARVYNAWELLIGQLEAQPGDLAKVEDEEWSLQHAIIENHYDVNGAWIEDGQLLREENVAKIRHIPCVIVQGRYDIVCPPATAWELHKLLPSSKLYMIPNAGHSGTEPGTRQRLTEVCDEFGKLDL